MKRKKIGLVILNMAFFSALLLGLFLIWHKRSAFFVKPEEDRKAAQEKLEAINENLPTSPISGRHCESGRRRPMAVMLSGDLETRPLSGIGQADLVFEMEVIEGSITRLMAVFICGNPVEIGSVRSARRDFIPLALGLDAIYAHWGGSYSALEKLKTGVIDNLDTLPNLYNSFYRKAGIEAPHNGFTSITRLLNAAQKMNRRVTGEFAGYPHQDGDSVRRAEKKTLAIQYAPPFDVKYEYDPETNSYLRFRGKTKEIDRTTGKQVEANNVVIMRANSKALGEAYNEVEVEGQGKAEFYLNGQMIQGQWSKDKNNPKSKLFFYNDKKEEIKFMPGSVWVEIADPKLRVSWE
jgi:hypothetical protein